MMVSRKTLLVATVRLGAISVLVATAVLSVETKVGPVMLTFGTGHGFHAVDALLIIVDVPITVVLLRYAERLQADGKDEAGAGRFWKRRL